MFRRRATKSMADASSSPRCVMCGVEVSVDAGGFCPLGHYVGAPLVPVDVAAEPARTGVPEPGAVFTEPTVALPVISDTYSPAAEPTVALPVVDAPDDVPPYTGFLTDAPADAAHAETGPADAETSLDALAAMFAADRVAEVEPAPAPEQVSAEIAPQAAPEPVYEAYATADNESEAQHALDELLAYSQAFSAGDIEPDGASSALDVSADDLPPMADEEPEHADTESIAAPDDEVDEVAAARRRAAGLLGGSVLTIALLAGSLAILPPF